MRLDNYNLLVKKANGVSALFKAGKGENFVEIPEHDIKGCDTLSGFEGQCGSR